MGPGTEWIIFRRVATMNTWNILRRWGLSFDLTPEPLTRIPHTRPNGILPDGAPIARYDGHRITSDPTDTLTGAPINLDELDEETLLVRQQAPGRTTTVYFVLRPDGTNSVWLIDPSNT